MRVRPATPADAPRVAALHAASWRNAYRGILSDAYLSGDIVGERTAVWSNRLAFPQPRQHAVLAEIDGALAGFACAFGASDPHWGTLLDNLHVDPAHQRQGIGARLMAEVAAWCAAEQLGEGLFLWVLEPNGQARRFYERLGAVQVGQDEWLPPDGGSVLRLRYAWRSLGPLLRLGAAEGSQADRYVLPNTREETLEERRRLRAEYRDLYDEIAALLFRHDPQGINFESNTDEYEPEVSTILPRLRGCRSEEDALQVVHEEFIRWFGAADTATRERNAQIAAEIWQLWRRSGPA